MATNRLGSVLHHLLRRVAPTTPGEVSDAELIERYVRRGDEAAFELLIWRHGPMVLGLCQRLLHNEQDAEDAFQATFLVLVRKARSIGKREALASWLYKVAYRIACRARPRATMLNNHTTAVEDLAGPETQHDLIWRDLRACLDEEVARLPETYRRPIVLCYLEGKTHEEAARLLGWPKGTLATRLARGRQRMRVRLERRGLAVSSIMLAGVLAEKVAAGAVSMELVRSTLSGAVAYAAGPITTGAILSTKTVALTEGVLRMMWYSKMKMLAGALLALLVAGTGVGLVARQAWAGGDEVEAAQGEPLVANAQVKKPGGKKFGFQDQGASKEAVADLQREVITLRLDLETALKEIKDLRSALRLPAPLPEAGPLYRGRSASFWLEQAKDGDPSYRKEAITALGALVTLDRKLAAELLPVLVRALKDRDSKVGDAAIPAVASVGADAVPVLLEVVKDKAFPELRRRALASLRDMRSDAKAGVPLLIQILKEDDREIRYDVIRALIGIGPAAKAAVPALIQALKDEDARVRSSAVSALGTMKAEAKSAIPALVEVMGRRLEEIQKMYDQPRKKGQLATISIEWDNSPGSVIAILVHIDPAIRQLWPVADQSHNVADMELWPKVYEALKKKYQPAEK